MTSAKYASSGRFLGFWTSPDAMSSCRWDVLCHEHAVHEEGWDWAAAAMLTSTAARDFIFEQEMRSALANPIMFAVWACLLPWCIYIVYVGAAPLQRHPTAAVALVNA